MGTHFYQTSLRYLVHSLSSCYHDVKCTVLCFHAQYICHIKKVVNPVNCAGFCNLQNKLSQQINVYSSSCYSVILIFLADNFGQRALIGKVCMDRNDFVTHYKETTQECQEETRRWVSTVCYSMQQLCWKSFMHV